MTEHMTEPLHGRVPEPPRPRGRSRFLTVTLVAVLAAAAGAGAVIALSGQPGAPAAGPAASAPATAPPRGVSPSSPAASSQVPGGTALPGASGVPVPPEGGAPAAANGQLDAQAVADMVQPGMVNISAPAAYASSLSEGTGIVLSADGLVLTNNHVIRGTAAPTATLVNSGKTYKATILGYDAADDVALLRLAGASGLSTVTIGNSSAVRVGQPVLGLGNAQGQGGPPTVAPGKVTALNQVISPQDSSTGQAETLRGTIQTSAQIQEGDSGGPLANAAGQVIGMDTAAATRQSLDGTTLAGYAIPINTALRIARQIAAGQPGAGLQIGLPPFMGVTVADAANGCQGSGTGGLVPGGSGGFGGSGGGFAGNGGFGGPAAASGALVCAVYRGTPAGKAGLAPGDVITSANGNAVTSASGLISATASLRPGASMSLRYVEPSGTARSASVSLIQGPAK
jgi:S1-C subfamily serine protease